MTSGGIGLAATVGSSGTLSLVFGEGGGLLSLQVSFAQGFWAAFGIGTGIGALLAGAMLAGQYFYKRHLKHIEEKIKRSIQHSRIDARNLFQIS